MLRAIYLVLGFVLSCVVSGNALQSTTYTTLSDRKTSAYYGAAPVKNFFNRSTLTTVECSAICEEDPECGGVNFCEISGDLSCETLKASPDPIDPIKVWNREGCLFYHRSSVIEPRSEKTGLRGVLTGHKPGKVITEMAMDFKFRI